MNDYDVIDREPGDNQNPMTFCDADACCTCGVVEGELRLLAPQGGFLSLAGSAVSQSRSRCCP